MIYLIQKLHLNLAIGFLLVILVSACSLNSCYKYRINDTTSYLNTTPLNELYTPTGITLPIKNRNYIIPNINKEGIVGKALDISPPAINKLPTFSEQNQYDNTTAIVVENWCDNTLWQQIIKIIKEKNYAINKYDNNSQTLITDWITWHQLNKNHQHRGRYQISIKQDGYQQVIIVKLLNLEQKGNKQITHTAFLHHYSKKLLHIIFAELKKHKQVYNR